MKKIYNLFCALLAILPVAGNAQETQPTPLPQGMHQRLRNYNTFAPPVKHITEEANERNSAYKNHPELGMLFAEAPAADCYELLSERTETTKTFVKDGTNGHEIMMQTSTAPMHYKDAAGRWMTIKTKLQPLSKGIFAATEQPDPVTINVKDRYTKIQHAEATIVFNNELELVYLSTDGHETSLGTANWKHFTAGDDGVYVTDIWPGIDMEVYTSRGTTKTNFLLKQAMTAYAAGKLLLRDHINTPKHKLTADTYEGHEGNIAVTNEAGEVDFQISAATAWEKNNPQRTLQMLGYNIKNNILDIIIPGNYLNRPASAYPIVIDPLVTASTASAVGGSSYSPGLTVSCNYVNAATVPPNVQVTDVRWSFNYVASGGALLLNGAMDFMYGTCRSPNAGGIFWFCNLASAGTCTGTNVSIYPDISACLPPTQCPSYPLNLTMRFYQNYMSTPPCATTYITSGSPLTVTVHGRTIETTPATSAGGLTSICLGQSVTLSTTTSFGVPPYTYVWNPGATAGNPVTITPAGSSTYTVTATDACGQTAESTINISVNALGPVSGTGVVCASSTITLTPPAGAGTGTWTSSNNTIAVVGPSSGVVTGVSAGTATITWTNTLGCYATGVVTVLAMPGNISGPLAMCVGNSVTLTNPMPGGTWTSGTPTVATVGPSTGVVTGMSPGNSMITYSTSPGCTAYAVVTVHPNPSIASVIQSNPTGCGATDGSITLIGLTPGTTYTVSYLAGVVPVTVTLTADASGQIVISGLSAGSYSSITVTSPEGCNGTTHGTLTLVDAGAPPMPVPTSNAPICDGMTLVFNVTSVPGATFTWWGPAGFTSVVANPIISPATAANAGVYSVTATHLGCVSLIGTINVVVNPIPNITNITYTNPLTCGGNEGTITLEGLVPGVTYNVAYQYNGSPVLVSITADAGGFVTITGLKEGTYADFLLEAFTCTGKASRSVTLKDPAPPPPPVATSNAPICTGLTLLLFATDDLDGGTYTWKGPNGFTAAVQNPTIPAVTKAAEGVYTVTYTRMNCSSTDTMSIVLQPEMKLKDVGAARYQIAFGDSVQLFASGASFYIWSPHNKTLNDYYIPNPIAYPSDSIATFSVLGMNEWGCRDSANVTIRVVFDEEEYIPNSFTPNNDGLNDIFRIGKMRFKKLVDFTIYNRWGQEVYHNAWDPTGGWDGTTNGVKQDVGVYFYSIVIESASGKLRYYKGDVTLLR